MVIDYRMNDWPIPYPNTGTKCLVTFGLPSGTSKDWVVGPAMTATENSSFEFYGRNYESNFSPAYGQGRASVVVTTDTENPTDISKYENVETHLFPFDDSDPVSYSTPYRRYETDLSAYAGQRVRVGILMESTDGLAYFLDDLQFNHFEDADFVGVEDVAVDAAAPAEYFNLQGVRVANPSAGTVYIVRRGASVTKQLMR